MSSRAAPAQGGRAGRHRLTALAVALLWLLPSPLCAQTPMPDAALRAPSVPITHPQALTRTAAALSALRRGQRQTVRILHLGDSLTASDRFSGRVRQLLQDRYGDAGRALMVPAMPFSYYRPTGATIAQTGDWQVLDHVRHREAGPFALAGTRVIAGGDGAVTLTWEAEFADAIARVSLDLLAADVSAVPSLTLDGQTLPLSLELMAPELIRLTASVERPGKRLTLSVDSGDMVLLGWGLESGRPGVLYDSLGVVGARATHLARLDPSLTRAQVEAFDPDLVVLAFGTNEGFDDDLDVQAYVRDVAQVVRELGLDDGGTDFLVVTPPAALRHPSFCKETGQPSDGDALPPVCRPLAEPCQDPLAYRAALASGDPALCHWHQPPALAQVRTALIDLAEARGWAWWPWDAVMGQPCGMNEWSLADPKLAFGDRVHLTSAGAALSGEALFAALVAALER